MWIDGWCQIYNTSKAFMLTFLLSSILICCRISFVHSHCILLLIVNAAFIPLGKMERQTNREADRLTDRQGVEGETAQQPSSAPTDIIICAVTQDISQLCLPWTLPWVLGGRAWDCRCDYPFTDPLPLCPQTRHPLFLICPLTPLIKKNPNRHFP